MKIIVKKIACPAEVKEVKRLELEDMQKIVGGLIEPIYIDEETICWCNEEGKLFGLDVNIVLETEAFGEIADTVHGDIFFTSADEDDESLNDRQVENLLQKLNKGIYRLAKSDMHAVPVLTI